MFNTEFLAVLRGYELEEFAQVLPAGARVLELGGGTGQQARMLSERGFDIVSIDVEGSEYENERVFDVQQYDGKTLPFEDDAFDVVLSSNVLEHIEDLAGMHAEMIRVLRPGGLGIHAMPTHAWRFWTSVAHYVDLLERLVRAVPGLLPRSLNPKRLLLTPLRGLRHMAGMLYSGAIPVRHGERGNVISEIGYFHPAWWRREFCSNGWQVVSDRPMGLFYTGYMVLGARLGLDARVRLRRVLGSACHLFLLRPADDRKGQS